MLKVLLMCTPIMAYADSAKSFVLYTDENLKDLGAILAQNQDGRERVKANASRTLRVRNNNPLAYIWVL